MNYDLSNCRSPVMKYFFFLIFFLVYIPPELKAQVSEVADSVTIKTKTDSLHVGILMNISKDSITIYNEEDGRLSFGRSEIKYFKDGLIKNKFVGTTNISVPYFVQTAITNERGNHYYKNYYLFGNEFNFGTTDNLNITLGFETATLVFNESDQIPIVQLGAKYRIASTDAAHFAISTKYYFNNEGNILFLSTPFTFGTGRSNFTISPNYLHSSNNNDFALLSNLSLALSNKTRLVIDFGFIDGERPMTILLERIFKSGLSASIGTFAADGVTIPNLSFSIPFGKWKNKN